MADNHKLEVLPFAPQMIRIPAGKFLMGSSREQAEQAIKIGTDRNLIAWECPQHSVCLSEYFIGKYPVTHREYQAFVKYAGYAAPAGWSRDDFPAGKANHPVVNVSWKAAVDYCNWLSAESGKHYRLPSEAEWEKAARWCSSSEGTTDSGRALIYPWGDQFSRDKANLHEARLHGTSDVGRFSPQGDSPYGCADMLGNVWEWCNDWFEESTYKSRADRPVEDPSGPQKGSSRVLRGGSFMDDCKCVRAAARGGDYPMAFYDYLGFRVCVSRLVESSD